MQAPCATATSFLSPSGPHVRHMKSVSGKALLALLFCWTSCRHVCGQGAARRNHPHALPAKAQNSCAGCIRLPESHASMFVLMCVQWQGAPLWLAALPSCKRRCATRASTRLCWTPADRACVPTQSTACHPKRLRVSARGCTPAPIVSSSCADIWNKWLMAAVRHASCGVSAR